MRPKINKYFPIIYAVVLLLGFLYVRAVLKQKNVQIISKDETQQSKAPEVKEVTVTLTLQNGATNTKYQTTLKNLDSVNTLLQHARDTGFVYYEMVQYLDKVEIQVASNNILESGWHVFVNDKDVTNDIRQLNLEDGANYILKKI